MASYRLEPDRGDPAGQVSEYEQTVRALLESAAQGILGINSAGVITMANAMAERLFGYSRREILGQSVEVLIPEALRRRHAAHRANYFSEPHVRPMGQGLDLTARRKDGTEFPVEVSLSFVKTSRGMLAVSFITDITGRKEAEQLQKRQAEELARSNAELEQFAYAASHDLQEPLRNITAFAELLASRYGEVLDEQGREFLGYITSGTARMNELINSLLAYSRVTSSQDANPFEPVDLNEIVDIARMTFRTAVRDTGATIEASDLPTVHGDRTQLIQLVQNLLGNALKYKSEKQPEIRISAESGDGDWIITVTDNGIGIPQQHHERVFELFKRLDKKNQYPGTGIGLTICKRIVQRHGGRIWIESPGEGTAVRFSLPKHE